MLEACLSMCMMDLDYLLCVCHCSPSASVLYYIIEGVDVSDMLFFD